MSYPKIEQIRKKYISFNGEILNLYFERMMKMDEEIKKALDEEIKSEIEKLSSMQDGSEEKEKTIEGIARLYKLRSDEKCAEDGKNTIEYLRLGLEAAGIVLPLIFYAYWMGKGFKFEEKGTFTSTTFRSLFNRFKPTSVN